MAENKQQKSDIRVLKMSNYVRPKVVEEKSREWVLNGKQNSFYQYIIDRYNGSPTNAAIINSYSDLIYGNGLRNTNRNIGDFLKFQRMLAPDEVRKIVSDFELFGEASFQIIRAKDSSKLPTIYHLPKENTVPKKANEDNVIESYYFCEDWSKPKDDTVEEMPVLKDEKTAVQCWVIRPYKAGKVYFSDPDYLAGMPYAELEEEMSNYYVNHIKQGLSFGYIINIPDGNSYSPEEKDELERKIKSNLTGSSNAGKFVINFQGRDEAITVETIDNNDAHSQWEYLTEQSRQQLMTAHRVTSPMLFGIKDSTGLGNNADELDTAEEQLMKRVIAPKQRHILDAFETVAAFYGLNLDLIFKPLTEPKNNPVEDAAKKLTFSADDLRLDLVTALADDAPEGYEIDRVEDCSDELEEDDFEKEINEIHFASVKPKATSKSSEDSPMYKVRYRYKKAKTPKGKSRAFCQQVHSLSGNNKFFRKEDINLMSTRGVNRQFGHNGQNYSIWKYKGGVSCHDVWERVIFKKKLQDDGEPFRGNPLQNVTQVKSAPNLKAMPTVVKTPPIDMPNNGHHPNYKG